MPPIFLDPVETFWIATNLIAAIFTSLGLRDAWRDRLAIDRGNGQLERIIAGASVRAEAIRITVQLLLLAVVIPGAFVNRPVPLNPLVLALMAVPVLLAFSSMADWYDRQRLNRLREQELVARRLASFSGPPGQA